MYCLSIKRLEGFVFPSILAPQEPTVCRASVALLGMKPSVFLIQIRGIIHLRVLVQEKSRATPWVAAAGPRARSCGSDVPVSVVQLKNIPKKTV